ncbi:MAG: LysR family transcriptional regulator, partial [Proteobacteria bacterium]|nr:LysR family transcriptional regulator [Pseudomonadota bacterium]
MRAQKLDLNLYRVFEAIYQEGSLTRAGEVLHMTQPAVSNALTRLR